MLKILGVLLLATLAYSQLVGETFEIGANDSMLLDSVRAVNGFYNLTPAVEARRSNFFCLERYLSETPNDEGYFELTYRGYENNGNYVWSVFVQFPLLAYLDTSRKRALIDVIIQVLNTGNPSDVPASAPRSIDDVCLGPYSPYELTTFQEGMIIHIYGNGSNINANEVSEYFQDRVRAELNGDSGYVVSYPGQRDIIAFDLQQSSLFNQTNNLHPGAPLSEEADPTRYAVYIASYGFNRTIHGPADSDVSRDLTDRDEERVEDNFAENPNPINYGLEAGDIVFAVIGSILLVLVSGAIVFGYVIHPFFLA